MGDSDNEIPQNTPRREVILLLIGTIFSENMSSEDKLLEFRFERKKIRRTSNLEDIHIMEFKFLKTQSITRYF